MNLEAELEKKRKLAELEAEERRANLLAQKEILEMEEALKKVRIQEMLEQNLSDEDDLVEFDPNENKNVNEWLNTENQNQSTRPHSPVGMSADTIQLFAQQNELMKSLVNVQVENLKQSEAAKNIASAKIGRERNLPTFGGEPEVWPMFISDFEQSTQVFKIQNIDNRFRLQKALKGKALDAVHSLLVHPDNVPEAIETLRIRFGRPEFIIESLIEKSRQIKKIRDDQVESLIEFSSTVTNLASTIENLKRPAHLSNPQLLKELEDKLPFFLRIVMGQSHF